MQNANNTRYKSGNTIIVGDRLTVILLVLIKYTALVMCVIAAKDYTRDACIFVKSLVHNLF